MSLERLGYLLMAIGLFLIGLALILAVLTGGGINVHVG